MATSPNAHSRNKAGLRLAALGFTVVSSTSGLDPRFFYLTAIKTGEAQP